MPAAKPEEFRRRAVELAQSGAKPVAEIAKDLGISESGLRRWMAQSDVEDGRAEGLTRDERAELVRLRRENRVQAMEIEMADSSGGRNEFCELLRWCQIAERFAWSSVERVLDRAQLSAGDDAQIGALRQVLA